MATAVSGVRELISSLQGIVGDVGILTGDAVRMRSCDPFRHIPAESPAIVRPASTAELSRVVALCAAHRHRIVVHGGRTGVSGGAFAGADELVISLERMNKIEEICPVSHIAVVQAGVALEALQIAAAEKGLLYPVDLGAKGSATIGGTIATNAGGNRVLRWGMTRQNVLGVEVVLADGTVVSSMNRLIKNNTGYDLKHLFIGSEGTLGIVTRAVMRLVASPVSQSVAVVSVSGYQNLLSLLTRASTLVTLSAFEVMWHDYYELVAASHSGRRPVAPNQSHYVLIEAMGQNKDLDQKLFEQFLEGAYAEGLIAEAVVASSDKQVADLWRVREGSEVLMKAFGSFVSSDVSIDVRRVDEFLERLRTVLRTRYAGARTATFGHLADNNIHIAINVGPDTVREEPNVEALLFKVVGEFEGAITAEHGIGQLKREFLPDHRSAAEMTVMRRMRAALDPEGLLNQQVLFRRA